MQPTRSFFDIKLMTFWLLVFLFSATISVPQGGMLTPASLLSEITYSGSGIMSPSGENGKGISVLPGIPFHFGWLGSWHNGWMPPLAFAVEYIQTGQGEMKFFDHIVWNLEQIFVTSIRVHFFPILGVFFMCFQLDKMREGYFSNRGAFNFKQIGFCGGILFLVGFIISFSINLNGFKWELSRFLIPGVSIGMLGLALTAVHVMAERASSRKIFVVLILLFVLMGPTINLVGTSGRNASNLYNEDVVADYFFALIGSGPIVN